jgi:hypothetical protein
LQPDFDALRRPERREPRRWTGTGEPMHADYIASISTDVLDEVRAKLLPLLGV